MYRACKFLAEIVPRFVEMKKSEPNNQAKIETNDWTELARAVRKIALDKRFATFDRRHQVADLVVKELRANGQFCPESAFRFALDRVQTLTAQSAAVEVHTLRIMSNRER